MAEKHGKHIQKQLPEAPPPKPEIANQPVSLERWEREILWTCVHAAFGAEMLNVMNTHRKLIKTCKEPTV